MPNFNYTRAEVEALVGRRFETLVEWDRVTKGMRGRVIWSSGCMVWAAQSSYEKHEVVITWDLPQRGVQTRALPPQLWFSKFQMQNYLREMKA